MPNSISSILGGMRMATNKNHEIEILMNISASQT